MKTATEVILKNSIDKKKIQLGNFVMDA